MIKILSHRTVSVASRKIFNQAKLGAFSTFKYTQSHEYIKIDGKIGTIGITDHAANLLGDVVFVDLPEVGKEVVAGESFGSVESVKAASDVYAPLSGKVVEINKTLVSNPEEINKSPFQSGWFIKIDITDDSAKEGLLNEMDYKKHCEKAH